MKSIGKKGIWVLVAILILVIGGVVLWVNAKEDGEKRGTGKDRNEVSYRSSYHFTTPDKWKNDPQKPIYYKGEYHYYYLYNKDYPDGNGTEWRHAVSKDLVHWKDEGVAIPKYTNDNGDPWSGSVVIDRENKAGFGKDAFIAIVTQPSKETGAQEQYLWYSTDGGKTFKNHSEAPVLENPGVEDFRDPKVVWDDERDKWVMLMAEGEKVGFYESENLKDWSFTGDFQTNDLGVLECPDLFRMRTEDGTEKWVLGVSANGESVGKPNTYAYWSGEFNGDTFEADEEEPKWLDYGFDWYGAVTFEDGEAEDKLEKRYALAWMNKWSYANNTPTIEHDDFNGTDSIVREIRLEGDDEEGYTLVSNPVPALDDLVTSTDEVGDVTVEDGRESLDVLGDTYRLEADISWEEAERIGMRLRESEDDERHVDVGFSPRDGYSFVNRSKTDHPDEEGDFLESKAPFKPFDQSVHMTILVDKTSVELFMDNGRTVHTNLVFPRPNDQGISFFVEGGSATFENVKIDHLGETEE
ncbi:levanase [Rossellomorea marisflavi]|uniref:Levanase n=1 Tax=Rossellomorea marisflavi TaxID=189381 RepID=A0A0M0G025_9BACI|nr:glycoside hydrolase family 32 protein [Rossellomorea marisflavi]KON83165.1 levanase [Rossellomorea marisflavi]MCM2589876.1 glycoside hydrolase family 32 protein [Rossellomorea marisflavi]